LYFKIFFIILIENKGYNGILAGRDKKTIK
jgi:hypothetical protein